MIVTGYDKQAGKEQFDVFYEILCDGLPESEHRSYEKQKALLEREEYQILFAKEGEETVGVIAYWDFGDFIFGEHFVVRSSCRNKGYGRVIFEELLKLERKIVIEVEPPTEGFSIRRIKMYERLGLRTWDYEYYQPPMQKGFRPLRLVLMTNTGDETQETLTRYKDKLYAEVYKNCTE